MADFINVGFGNMVNGDKIISMVSTDAAPVKRMIQNARDEGKAVDATCGRRTRTVLVMESDHLILSALTTDTLSSRCHSLSVYSIFCTCSRIFSISVFKSIA